MPPQITTDVFFSILAGAFSLIVFTVAERSIALFEATNLISGSLAGAVLIGTFIGKRYVLN